MAFKRETVKEILSKHGIETIPNDLVTSLMNLHAETRDAIIEDKVKPLEQKISELEKFDVKESEEYKKISEEFETFKGEVKNQETNKSKLKTLKDVLKEHGANEKFIERMTKGFDLSSVELDKDGKVKNADKVVETFKAGEWGDVFGEIEKKTFETNGNKATPSGKVYTKEIIEKMSTDEINANWGEISQQLDKF